MLKLPTTWTRVKGKAGACVVLPSRDSAVEFGAFCVKRERFLGGKTLAEGGDALFLLSLQRRWHRAISRGGWHRGERTRLVCHLEGQIRPGAGHPAWLLG